VHSWVVYWDAEKSLEATQPLLPKLDEVAVFAADFDKNRNLQVQPWVTHTIDDLKQTRGGSSPRILLTVVNDIRSPGANQVKNPDLVDALISDPARRAAHVADIVALAEQTDGVEIDYEAMWYKNRDHYTQFIKDLAAQLHAKGKTLSVVVEPKTSDVKKNREGAVDWAAVGQYADSVKIMAYLYHYPSGKPGPLAPAGWVEEIARFAQTQIPKEKLSIVLTMNGCDWPDEGSGKPMTYRSVAKIESQTGAGRRVERSSASPYFRYDDRDMSHQVWFEDAASLSEKIKRLRAAGIDRIGLWYIGSGDPLLLQHF
jgi:spore germination protein YaaH